MSIGVVGAIMAVIEDRPVYGSMYDFSGLDAIIQEDGGVRLNEPVETGKTILDRIEELAEVEDYYNGDKGWGRFEVERYLALSRYLSNHGAKYYRELP